MEVSDFKIIEKYTDGKPKFIKWSDEDNFDRESLFQYTTSINPKKHTICYNISGYVFDIEIKKVIKIEKRIFIKDLAINFFNEMRSKYPISHLTIWESESLVGYY